MALFSENVLRDRLSRQTVRNSTGSTIINPTAKAERIITESKIFQNSSQGEKTVYDIFLSHSTKDAELISGLKLILNDLGYVVYVDWLDDPQLDRSRVTKNTARVLQGRMRQCKSLIYAFSENSGTSKWMPWELGYFDGLKQKAAVLPITKTKEGNSFKGTEYLGIYYYITIDENMYTKKLDIWVQEEENIYTLFKDWLSGAVPAKR